MKRCPECRRDYYDDSLLYCLDDGGLLLEGPSSVTDPQTAILSEAAMNSNTAIFTHGVAARAVALDSPTRTTDQKRGGSLRTVLVVTIALAVLGGAFITYRYFAAGTRQIRSIAVMPFVNAGGSPDVEYLSDGMTETLIGTLSQLPDLAVKARSSVFRYKGREVDTTTIGRELNVQAILSGRVVQRGDEITLTLELIDTSTENVLWTERYVRKLADIFVLQTEIAKEVSSKLRVRLSGTEQKQLSKLRTENLKAFQYYIQGRSYAQRRTKEDLATAIRYCEQAIGEDNNYALAYAGLAEAYAASGIRGYIAPDEGRTKAEAAARKAVAIDDDLAEAHAALALTFVLFAPHDFELSDRELRRALELSPSLAIAHHYLALSFARQGKFDDSIAEYLKAREFDPLSPIINRGLAIPYLLKRDYARARETLRQAGDESPAFIVPCEIGIYIQNGDLIDALSELDKAKKERSDDPILIYSTGMIYAAQGKRTEALQVIKQLESMSVSSLSEAHYIAKIYAGLNEKDLALGWLERGMDARQIGDFFKDEPVWDTIREDPRFARVLVRMGYPN